MKHYVATYIPVDGEYIIFDIEADELWDAHHIARKECDRLENEENLVLVRYTLWEAK